VAARFHRVLKGVGDTPGFIRRIDLPEDEEADLRSARDDIRECIRGAFRDVADRSPLMKRFLVEDAPPVYRTDGFLNDLRPTPRFRGQGSYSYKTLNDPVPDHTPPQQVDLDDGVFLPTSFMNQGERPALAAKGYFKVIEDALAPLCTARGWKLCRDKPSCVRVVLDEKTHIDLPLYAIPDEDYATVELLEKSLHSRGLFTMDSAEFAEESYRGLPEDHIMLALRNGDWIRSDPRKLHDWFQGAVAKHGPHLRHVCRYLKAWRDFEWMEPEDSISSIALMAMAVRVFDENRQRLDSSREDEALLTVAERMPALLGTTIKNPVLPDHESRLDKDWTPEMRAGFIDAARRLRDDLLAARDATKADAVIARLQSCLGDRVPTDHSLVEIAPPEEASILAKPRVFVPLAPAGRTTSG
jgi:hypothetical protein